MSEVSEQFSDSQIVCIYDSLIKEVMETRRVEKLKLFYQNFHQHLTRMQLIDKVEIAILYGQGEWQTLFRTIQTGIFSIYDHQLLQQFWFNAHYHQTQKEIKKDQLSAVDRHRVRNRNPLPLSINPFVPKTKYKVPIKVREMLQQFFDQNPTPSTEERRRIAAQTGRTLHQVTLYFRNRRRRPKPRSSEKL